MRLFGIEFGGESPDDESRRTRDEASRRAIQAGGLPPNAVERLQEAAGRRFFTSNLTPSELVLTHECGYEPKGQVMGTSVYNVGWQWTPGNVWGAQSQELETITAAHYEARHLALGRLRQEAKLLRADGVVGVRLQIRPFEGASGLLEFLALGTAVRRTDAPPSGQEPFLSDLSGADHWALREAGYRPVGFCLGNCTWYQVGDLQTQNAQAGGWLGGSWQNQELVGYTHAMYQARHLAVSRMAAEAQAAGGEGIVGVTLHPEIEERHVERGENQNARRDLVVTFNAVGTAVVRDTAAPPSARPLSIVRLR